MAENIETRCGPAKRAILEPDRILTAAEVVARVCEHFEVPRLPYLTCAGPDQAATRNAKKDNGR